MIQIWRIVLLSAVWPDRPGILWASTFHRATSLVQWLRALFGYTEEERV
jgi:hypothetical protein